MQVCSTEYVYHALLNTDDSIVDFILSNGLRPLSDFPDSPRWKQINEAMPGFFENLYQMIGQEVLNRPYRNAGVFVSPIDFKLMPNGSPMAKYTRVRIPIERIKPDDAVLTYVLDDKRVNLPLNTKNLQHCAEIWTAEMVQEWFGRDQSKIFYYVPQIAVYQEGGIPIQASDIEYGS